MKAGLLYSATNRFKRNLQITEKSLRRFFMICQKPYLSLSFGKQSLVLAHIIYQIRPETPMLFLRSWESYYLHNFEDIIDQFTKKYKINLIIHYKDNVSWNDWDWKQTRDFGQHDLQNMADEAYPAWDGVIMGLSKDESVARRISCSQRTTAWRTIFRYKSGKYRCTPIQFWSLLDLAAYISINDIPLLESYRYTGLGGRTVARITRNCAEMNGLIELKKRDINNYNKIISRFPELAAKG